VFAAQNKKPDPSGFQKALGPLIEALNEVKGFKEKNFKTTKNPNHLNAIAEGISALGWVAEALPVR
jgi:hypothetical protein